MSASHRQEAYKANQKRLGLTMVTAWLPETVAEAFLRAADDARLTHFESVLQHGDAIQIEALAARNTANVDQAMSFAAFIEEHPELIEGGARHKQAVTLFNRYRKLVRAIHQQRGEVASLMAINSGDVLRAKAELAVMGQRMRQILNERDWLVKAGPVVTVNGVSDD